MVRGDRSNVAESHDMFIAVNLRCRYISSHDPAKKAIRMVMDICAHACCVMLVGFSRQEDRLRLLFSRYGKGNCLLVAHEENRDSSFRRLDASGVAVIGRNKGQCGFKAFALEQRIICLDAVFRHVFTGDCPGVGLAGLCPCHCLNGTRDKCWNFGRNILGPGSPLVLDLNFLSIGLDRNLSGSGVQFDIAAG